MSSALLGDPAMVGRSRTRLPYARIEAEVADELFRSVEAPDLADCGGDGERHDHVDPGDCHQAFDTLVP